MKEQVRLPHHGQYIIEGIEYHTKYEDWCLAEARWIQFHSDSRNPRIKICIPLTCEPEIGDVIEMNIAAISFKRK
jgi:hypothetical protein